MSDPLRQRMSLAEFLAWEERQEVRHEFDGTGPVAMTGGSVAHATIQANLAAALVPRLRGGPCRFYGSDIKIEVAGRIRYPDGLVACGPVDPGARVVTNPVIVFEVLSPATSGTDRIVKSREYGATPSIARYVLLEQDRIAATVLARDGAGWRAEVLVVGSVLALPEAGTDVPLAALYDGLDVAE